MWTTARTWHEPVLGGRGLSVVPCDRRKRQETMAWYYEILGKDEQVLETSEPIYGSQIEAQYAAYQRVKEKPGLFGPMPITGGRVEGGLRGFLAGDRHIRAKQKDD